MHTVNSDMFVWIEDEVKNDISGYSLILPSVSVGNVGQLAVDLLISTLPTTKVAIIHHDALLPLVGQDPYRESSRDITTAADLHVDSSHSVALIQIRTPLVKSERASFLEELVSWAKRKNVKEVIILTSCHAYERTDRQIAGPQLRYLTSNLTAEQLEALRLAGLEELEPQETGQGQKTVVLQGAGFVNQLMEICDIPTVTLLMYVDEGDNTQDAVMLASCLNSWKKLMKVEERWTMPCSWKNLFGGPAPVGIY